VKETDNVRKMQFRKKFKKIVEKGNLYDKYHEVVLKVSNLPPHNSTFYHKFDEFVMPKTEGMTDEEVEKNIIKHWHDWNKPKNQIEESKKQNKREQLLEFRKAKTEAKKQEKKLLQENRTVFPNGFWKEPTALIPKDKSEFPDFPNIDGLSKEEADISIIEFWKKLAEKKGNRTFFPKGFWKEPTALIPTDKSEFFDFPNIDGLPKEEADKSIIEYWKKLKEKKDWSTANTKNDFILDDEGNAIYQSIKLSSHRTKEQKLALGIEVLSKEDRRRKNEQRQKEFAEKYQRKKGAAEKNPLSVLQKAYLYQNLVDEFGADPACEVPDDEEALMNMFEPPEDIATYPGYPNLDGLGEDDANEAVKTFLVSWRKEEAQRRLKNMKNKKKNKKKTKTERAIAQDKSKNNEKNQGNQRKGRNERNRGRNEGNQGRNDRNQVPYWAVWDQGGNSAGNSSQEFGRGFGRNPDWLQQQPSGYSRSSSQDTGYNSYGNYNSYDNYNQSSSGGYYNQPGFAQDYNNQGYNQNYNQNYSNQGYGNQAYGNQQSHDSNYDDYYQQFDGRQSNKRNQNPMMPDRGPSAKKFKPDLPKPAQNSAKILAQLKNCPFGVNVYQSRNKKMPITGNEFTEIMAIINQKWLEQSGFGENLRIEGSEWHKDRGIILCQDEFSRKWIQASIDEITIGNKFFKAWSTGDTGDVIDVSVILGPALDKCPDPRVVISKALENAGIAASNIEVVNVGYVNGGRRVSMLLDGQTVQAIQAKNGRIFAGLTQLNFKIE